MKGIQLSQDMLQQGNLIFLLTILMIYGCNKSKKKEVFVEDANFIKQFSSEHILESEYSTIYKKASDSLKNWCYNNLSSVIELKTMSYKLDSILCFNDKKDKLIGAILIPCTITSCMQDDIRYLYGVKLDSNWYYTFGPTIVLPQSHPETPRTFLELHEIAMDSIFKGYLKKDERTDRWEINDHFFDRLDYSKWGFFDKEGKLIDNSTLTQLELDSLLLDKAVYSNWRDRDTTNFNSKE